MRALQLALLHHLPVVATGEMGSRGMSTNEPTPAPLLTPAEIAADVGGDPGREDHEETGAVHQNQHDEGTQ
jgi:hypothetical protein